MMDDEEEEIPVPINNDLERRIAETFEVYDYAGNKTIDTREIGTVVRSLGCCPSEAEVQEIALAIEDPKNPGTVHLVKFLPHVAQLIVEHKFHPSGPDELLEAFRILDPDGRGFLTKEQISNFMTQDGEPFNQDELDEMLDLALDPHTQTVPYEYYINQLIIEPEGEDDIYKLADRVEAEKPPPPKQKRFSDFMKEINKSKEYIE